MSGPPQQKFVLRNDKIRDSIMSQDQASQHWNTIKEAIHKIYAKQASSLSYEELYRTAYNLVLHKHGDLLYNGVKNTTVELLQPIVEKLMNSSDEDLLKRMNEIWQQEKLCIIMIKDILMYMDRNYVPKLKLHSVEHLQVSQFKHHVILNQQIKGKLIQKLLSEIRKERDGGIVEITQLRAAIQMLVEVGISQKKIYEQEFEKPFISETQSYYQMESNQLITDNSCHAYLQKAKSRLNEELDRLLNYLDSSSEKILIKTFLHEYIQNHSLTLLNMENSGLNYMIKNDKYDEITLMHELFSKVPDSFNQMKSHLSNFIVNEGNKLVGDQQLKHDEFVGKVINLRDKMLTIYQRSFNRDPHIDITIKTSFEGFINQNDRTAMCLVYYLDEKFKKDFKGMNESEINDKLDKVIQIFRYLQDKDIFEGFYKTSLSKRLLDQRSVSEDAEKALVLKLKEECGFQFTQKLEVMFKDIKMSEETMNEFKQTALAKKLTIELSVKVLTTGNWPNETKDASLQVQLPKEIHNCITNFNKFYINKHTGRLLHWKISLGYADIRATLGENNQKYELQASTYQMCILLLFNNYNSVTYQQMLQMTQIPEIDLKCNLIPLLGIKLLNKSPNVKEFLQTDQYTLNSAFKNSLFRIRLPIAHAKETKTTEKNDVIEKVDEDRRHMVEATIVKVMKTRRRLDHNSLIAETTKILSQKFNPDPTMIKKRMESLIEREYMERDNDDRRYYKYIA